MAKPKITPVKEVKMLSDVKKQNQEHQKEVGEIIHITSLMSQYMNKVSWAGKIKGYKNYMLYNYERRLELKKQNMEWRTNFKTPLTRIMVDSVYSKMFDTEFDINVFGTIQSQTKEINEYSAVTAVDTLNKRSYTSSGVEDTIKKAGKDSVQTGDGYWFAWFNTPDETIAYNASTDENKSTKRIDIAKPSAVAEYVPRENVIYDIKQGFDKSPFVAVRRVEEFQKVLDRHNNLIDATEDFKKEISGDGRTYDKIFDYDYSEFRNLGSYTPRFLDTVYRTTEKDIYKNRNNKGESLEYYTNDKLIIIFNGILLYEGENPAGEIPIVHLGYNVNAAGGINLGVAQILDGIQELNDLVYNGYADFLKRHYNPMFLTSGGQRLEGFEEGYLEREPYKIIKNLGEGKVEKMSLGDDINGGFDMLRELFDMAGKITGVTRYTGAGMGEGIERSARASDYQVQITLDVIKPIVDSISKALNKTSRIWIRLAKAKLPPKSVVSIIGKDNEQEFKKIKTEDLVGEFIIRYKSETLDDYHKQKEIEKMNSFLNYQKMVGEDPNNQVFLYDQKKIADKVAELHELYGVTMTYKEVLEQRADFLKLSEELLPQQQVPEEGEQEFVPETQGPIESSPEGTQPSLEFEPEVVD